MTNDQFPSSAYGNWVTGSWQHLLPPVWAEIALILIAAVCGGIVGTERERHEKAAGLRTLVLVCIGSTVFTSVSFFFSGDTGRVASQIVVGIGFLGAGVILRSQGGVTGTTTAATIWVMASIGVVIGIGHAGAAVALSVLVRGVLGTLSYLETHLISKMYVLTAVVEYAPNDGITRVLIERTLSAFSVPQESAIWTTNGKELESVKLCLRFPNRHLRELLGELVEIPGVQAFHRESEGPS